jgi:hypothetical protein
LSLSGVLTADSSHQPDSDEFELSLFGPGFGECAVVHLGSGKWAIVDSCEDTTTRRPAGIGYLERLGVDVAADVELIIATHWHDDHIQGMARTVDACPSADFVCSMGLQTHEYMALLSAGDHDLLGAQSGVREFASVLRCLEERHVSPVWAKIGTRVWRSPDLGEVWAVAPTDFAIEEALRAVAALLPHELEPRRRTRVPGANHLSVATMFLLSGQALLLGGDLEEQGRADYGWSAVLASSVIPDDRCVLFKVPHHGSMDAYHADVWLEMMHSDSVAVLAPWELGGSKVPTAEGRAAICSHTSRAYISSEATPTRPQRSRQVEKIMSESTRYVRHLDIPTGHLRVRGPLGSQTPDDLAVELLRDARPLCD